MPKNSDVLGSKSANAPNGLVNMGRMEKGIKTGPKRLENLPKRTITKVQSKGGATSGATRLEENLSIFNKKFSSGKKSRNVQPTHAGKPRSVPNGREVFFFFFGLISASRVSIFFHLMHL